MDDTLKLWNGTSLAKPVHVATGLECAWEVCVLANGRHPHPFSAKPASN
jgi:hypothetical protein